MLVNASRVIRISPVSVFRNSATYRRPKAVYDDDGTNLLSKSAIDPIEPTMRTTTTKKSNVASVKPRVRPFSKASRSSWLQRKVKNIDDKLSANYDLIKDFISYNESKYFSKNNPYVLLEGERLIVDAIHAGVPIKGIYHDHTLRFDSFKLVSGALGQREDIKITRVLESDLKIASRVVTSPGIAAIVSKPTREHIEKYLSSFAPCNSPPITVVAAGICDPTNMGGLIRSAAAAGVSEIITIPPSVNIWNDKVIRTAAGAHFKVFISEATGHSDLEARLQTVDCIVCCESHGGQDFSHLQVSPSQSTALIVGNEADGIPETLKHTLESEALKSKVKTTSIPMSNGVDSLNNYVSASIILFHLKSLLTR